MTPRRRDRFFSSLRQLEQRLASESSPIKKTRLGKYKELADTEPAASTGLANANSFSKCGLADANTRIDNDEAVVVNDFRLADVNANEPDASRCGLAGANATLRCVLGNVNAALNCGLTDILASSSCDANGGLTGINLTSNSGLAGTSATLRCELNAASKCGSADVTAPSNCGSAGANSISNCKRRCVTHTSNCGLGCANAASRCGLADVNATALTHVRDLDLVLTGDLAGGHVGMALVHVKPALAPLAPREIDRLEHLEAPPAHLGSAGADLGGSYPLMLDRVVGTPHVCPAFAQVESASFGLTDVYPKPVHKLGGTAHTGCALACAQEEGVGLEDAYHKPSETLAKVASAGPLLTLVGSSANFQPSVALYRLTSVELADLKNAADGSEILNNKDAATAAEAMCLRSDTTIRRACTQDECTMNIIDNLPFNPQKANMMFYMDDRETRSLWENKAARSRDSAEVLHGSQCMSVPLARIIEGNGVHETADFIGGGQVFGDALQEGLTKNDNNKYDIAHRGDAVTSSGNGVHIVNVDYFAHGRESLDTITLCEDEEKMYESIFSGDNEDSGSLLELSAHWNPWEIGRHSGEFDSHPPAEFLSTPMTNNTLGRIDRKTPECFAKSLCHDLQEKQGDGLQDLTHLCALLGLDEHAWLPEVKDAGLALQTNKILSSDDSRQDLSALHHEHPGSTFYSNVAKVRENCFQFAKALDFWLQRLSQLQTEPYSCALLLMAKASLQKNRHMSKGFSCKFPSIIQEWLALQCVADQQELI